jgi:hypothetical protein
MSLMWFYDDGPEEYRAFREEAECLEREHLETRQALQKPRRLSGLTLTIPPCRPSRWNSRTGWQS